MCACMTVSYYSSVEFDAIKWVERHLPAHEWQWCKQGCIHNWQTECRILAVVDHKYHRSQYVCGHHQSVNCWHRHKTMITNTFQAFNFGYSQQWKNFTYTSTGSTNAVQFSEILSEFLRLCPDRSMAGSSISRVMEANYCAARHWYCFVSIQPHVVQYRQLFAPVLLVGAEFHLFNQLKHHIKVFDVDKKIRKKNHRRTKNKNEKFSPVIQPSIFEHLVSHMLVVMIDCMQEFVVVVVVVQHCHH